MGRLRDGYGIKHLKFLGKDEIGRHDGCKARMNAL